jgi:hypothetical protein
MEVLCRDPVAGNHALSWLMIMARVDHIDGTIEQVFVALPHLRTNTPPWLVSSKSFLRIRAVKIRAVIVSLMIYGFDSTASRRV